MVIKNGSYYCGPQIDSNIEAIAISAGKIAAMGNLSLIEGGIAEQTKIIDAEGHFVMPGFIEGHGHFSGLGKSLINVNLLNTSSWQEVLKMVEEKVKEVEPGVWIEGRGWHQEKWTELPPSHYKGYPYHDELSALSEKNPIVLYHASGHSLFANELAMKIAKVNSDTPDPSGGHIVRDNDGEALGVFEENAMDIIRKSKQFSELRLNPLAKEERWYEAIALAQEECLRKGITSFQDAGSKFLEVERYAQLAEEGKLDLRLWSMLRHSHEEMKDSISKAKIIGAGDGFYTCNAVKTEVDGALGSYGAWLLEEYSDSPGFIGQNTTSIEEMDRIVALAKKNKMQVCVHAIGDRANREVLNVFEKNGASESLDLRWRIEHAQHLHPDDIARFKPLGVIASMQGVHCTSDSPFVEKRLGRKRSEEGAYPWRSLLDSGALVLNGTDAPVEDVDPIRSYYATVTRKREDNPLAFFPEQKMTREEGLRSYTIDNAYAAFEESVKGTLEVGKYADIVILSENLLTCKEEKILNTEVRYTIVNGEVKHQNMSK